MGSHSLHHHVVEHQTPAQDEIKWQEQQAENHVFNEQGANQQADDGDQITVKIIIEFGFEHKAGEQDKNQKPDREVQDRGFPYKINQG